MYHYIVLPYNTRLPPPTQVKLKRAVLTRDPPERTNRVNWSLRKRRNIKTDKIVFNRKRPEIELDGTAQNLSAFIKGLLSDTIKWK